LDVPGIGHAQVLHYDNDADPAAHDDDYFAWHTRFWSAGLSTRVLNAALLFQGLAGSTQTMPSAWSRWTTDFWSAYALASRDEGDWRFSLRGDWFGTDSIGERSWALFSEHGGAVTGAVSWMPRDWLRLTAELVVLRAERGERAAAGLSKTEEDNQFQLGMRASI
jgi:hypothetical protein